ncbi:16S rRNA (cytosine(1402)-N(4))-methyltransferase RsmH [Candidatus Saccharibacteria bacterium]|nr:16S rRNA (cytosine(1402)-N(4))-methyltransferase RsmH [Candidatus Saccharibacteria bacterium]
MLGFELRYNEEMNEVHIPVLLSDVLKYLRPREGETYLDLTAGYGGHADKILEVTRNYKGAVLNDRDQNAMNFLEAKYQEVKPRLMHDDFYSTALLLVESGISFDMILADFGVSSPQLDNGERGFSFAREARLDMRMDESQELDAWMVVNKWSERKLADIFEAYAEERRGRAEMLAREICMHRPIETTTELADLIKSKSPYSHTHPATRIFQAIRIVVNDELGIIERTLPLLPKLLNPGGRVAIITFHSLEDRLVKEYFKEESSKGIESKLRIINKKPIIADNIEIANNPRARSAKLRVAERI